MFKKFKKFMGGEGGGEDEAGTFVTLAVDKTGQPSTHEMNVAAAVILVQVASSDDAIAREEAETVCALIESNLGVAQEHIPSLVESAVQSRRQKGSMDDFILLLNERYDTAQRKLLLAMVWKIVLADSRLEKPEEKLVIQLRNRLKLTHEDGVEAREMAQSGAV